MDGTLLKPTKMRAGIARRMTESKQQAPHFYVQTEVTMDRARDALGALATATPPRVTMTTVLIRACVVALREHPQFNAVWTPDGLMQASAINLGVAIMLDEGVVAPALLSADDLDVESTAIALADVVDRARNGKLRPAEVSDTTFTLSNLGMFDVSAFTAIITPPQVAILAIARPIDRWTFVDGTPSKASVMTATLSADHRALDGADAARFLTTFKQALETPAPLFASSPRRR